MERHCYFESEGARLLAALHIPDEGFPKLPLGLVYLHGWAGYRIGPHQMFTKAARRAEGMGFCSLRFDFRGRGDSEGDTQATTLTTMIADTVAATRFLLAETGLERVALIGDCSGSEVALGTGPLHEAIRAMVLWSAPIVAGDRRLSDSAKKRQIWLTYLRKAFRKETWQKLVGAKLQLGQIRRALASGGKGAGEEGAEVDAEIDWYERFMGFGGERLFIYGGNDPTTVASVEHYEMLCRRANKPFDSFIVPGANHAFYSLAWENQVIDRTLAWLRGQAGV
ncbi:alpha/beta fold hydrolase [bacterium]|nr:alpha/beta fold hydrolase [bacterium]